MGTVEYTVLQVLMILSSKSLMIRDGTHCAIWNWLTASRTTLRTCT